MSLHDEPLSFTRRSTSPRSSLHHTSASSRQLECVWHGTSFEKSPPRTRTNPRYRNPEGSRRFFIYHWMKAVFRNEMHKILPFVIVPVAVILGIMVMRWRDVPDSRHLIPSDHGLLSGRFTNLEDALKLRLDRLDGDLQQFRKSMDELRIDLFKEMNGIRKDNRDSQQACYQTERNMQHLLTKTNESEKSLLRQLDDLVTKYQQATSSQQQAQGPREFNYASAQYGAKFNPARSSSTFAPRLGHWLVNYFVALQTDTFPLTERPLLQSGDCWCFEGSKGVYHFTLARPAVVDRIEYQHVGWDGAEVPPLSAPRDLEFEGYTYADDASGTILGSCAYGSHGLSKETCLIDNSSSIGAVEAISVRVNGNHGQAYTCLYSIKVFGKKTLTQLSPTEIASETVCPFIYCLNKLFIPVRFRLVFVNFYPRFWPV
ncbi:unnamed protein product, partial [Mesorhabditis spiculigera]